MLSNNLKRHEQTHGDILSMTDDEVRKELRTQHAVQKQREERRQKVIEIAQEEGIPIQHYYNKLFPLEASTDHDLYTDEKYLQRTVEERLIKKNEIYNQKLKIGEKINTLLLERVIAERSLKKDDKEALVLYRKQVPRLDIQDVQLRIWQQQLLDIIKVSSVREVIWVKGVKGNEGKTWFQKYVQSVFGSDRVAELDLKSKTANILHPLRKFPLYTIDIFFFNDARAINYESCCYTALEDIKDGKGMASKFNSEVIHFKTPNVVVVFSNTDPDMKQLSKDRWKIYNITKDGLKSYEDRLWKLMHTRRDCQSDFGRKNECKESDYE